MKEKILDDFKTQKEKLDLFRTRICGLLQDLLSEKEIAIHQLSNRTKDIESLSRKIDRKEGKYKALSEITDLGIRIITYLESDVNAVADIVDSEFLIDKSNSIDKRILKTDQFGYKSLHVVVSLNEKRSALTEYKKYKGLKCEIQIRSILQHAWAEIEHDLGYKSKTAIPETSIRSFNRLAALLETADMEFDRLKKDLSEYEKEVPKLIEEKPQEVPINQASLNSLIETNNCLLRAKEITATITGATFYFADVSQSIIDRFEFFSISTIKQLQDSLNENQSEFLSFVEVFSEDLNYESFPSYLPIYYFQHFLAAKTENVDYVEKYFSSVHPRIDNSGNASERFIKIYQEAKK